MTVPGGGAWAVGLYFSGLESSSLVLRWNGTTWAKVTSPNPTGSTELEGVSATSGSNAWATGEFSTDSAGQDQRTLAFHCG